MTISHALNAYEKAPAGIKEVFWYEGSTDIKLGEALCYNLDFGTAGDPDARRGSRVELPSTTNNQAFAGVAVRSQAGKSVKQKIELYVPGSKSVPVALGVNTTIGSGLLTFATKGRYNVAASTGLGTDAGRFHNGVYRGRGSAIPRQTVTALLEDGILGTWSIAADGVTLTMTATSGISVGDTVVLMGGEDDGTGTVIPGKYFVSSITSGTVLVLTAVCVDEVTTALTCTGYVYTGNPTAICDLLDGEESGGIEFMNLPTAGNADMPYMVGGKTYICGGIDLDADVDVDLAQASLIGDKKCFILLADLGGGNDFTVDLDTTGLRLDGSTGLTEVLTIDDATDGVFLEFGGSLWHTRDLRVGATEG